MQTYTLMKIFKKTYMIIPEHKVGIILVHLSLLIEILLNNILKRMPCVDQLMRRSRSWWWPWRSMTYEFHIVKVKLPRTDLPSQSLAPPPPNPL